MKLTTQNLMIEPALSGGAIIRFETLDLKYQRELMHKYDGKTVTVEIKTKREGRSLDSNAYCWVLCGKIAETKGLLAKKVDIYKQAVKDYGVTYVMPVKDELLGDIIRWHESSGLGNACDVIGKSKFNGYTNVLFYQGSSKYDSKQMSVFLDGIIADAKDLGIQVETPEEIAKMKAMWGEV